MKRRDFVVLLGGATAAMAWPPIAGAQAPTGLRIGYVATSGEAMSARMIAALQQGLRDLGYNEQRVTVEVRYAEGRYERMPELVAELIGLKVDILVAGSSPGALAAKKATSTIPIVMIATDPVGLGLVASLARPGGNVTGLSYFNEAIIAKRVQLHRISYRD
jgi:putative ABC transport system substrate-binding protein